MFPEAEMWSAINCRKVNLGCLVFGRHKAGFEFSLKPDFDQAIRP